MKNQKKFVRVGALLCILMFLFSSLLIPNVSADDPLYEAFGSTADTVYDTTPSAYANCPSNVIEPYIEPGDVVFKCEYSFTNDHVSDPSYYRVIFTVDRTAPTPDTFQADTGWVFIDPESSDNDILTLSDYVADGTGWFYDVYVECYVKKNLEDTPTSDSDSYKWDV